MKILNLILLLTALTVTAQAQVLRTNILGLPLSTAPDVDNSYVPFSDSRTNNSSYRSSMRSILNRVGDNWVAEGTTNSTLPGIGKPWGLEVTNHVYVGQTGEAGIIELQSTNGTYTLTIKYDTDGALLIQASSPDSYDIPALRVQSATELAQGNIQDWRNWTNLIASLESDGTFFARRLFAINDAIPNGDDFTRIQSDDILIHPDLGTNTLLLSAAGHTILMLQAGATNFIVAESSGSDGFSTNLFLAADGHFYVVSGGGGASVNPTIGFAPYNLDGVNFGDLSIKYESSSNSWSKALQIGTVENYNPSPYLSGALIVNDSNSDGMFFDVYTGGTISNIDPIGFLMSMVNRKTPGGATTVDQQESWGLKIANSVNSAALTMAGDMSTGTIGVEADANSASGSVNEVGLLADGRGGATNSIAVYGRSRGIALNGATNIAVFGNIEPNALNTQIALLADAGVNSGTKLLAESAMVLADNRSTGYPLFLGRKANGTRQFYVNGTETDYSGTGQRILTDFGTYGVLTYGFPVANASFITTNLIAGTTDLYTVPAGQRAVFTLFAITTNGTAGTVAPQLKLSGSYYYLNTPSAPGTTAAFTIMAGATFVAEPGDILAAITTTAGVTIFGEATLFSTNSCFKSERSVLASGNNTLYTCPSGYMALGNTSVINGTTTLFAVVSQASGAPISYVRSINGVTLATASVSDKNATSVNLIPLTAGDAFVVNSPSADTSQFAYLTRYEMKVP